MYHLSGTKGCPHGESSYTFIKQYKRYHKNLTGRTYIAEGCPGCNKSAWDAGQINGCHCCVAGEGKTVFIIPMCNYCNKQMHRVLLMDNDVIKMPLRNCTCSEEDRDKGERMLLEEKERLNSAAPAARWQPYSVQRDVESALSAPANAPTNNCCFL